MIRGAPSAKVKLGIDRRLSFFSSRMFDVRRKESNYLNFVARTPVPPASLGDEQQRAQR